MHKLPSSRGTYRRELVTLLTACIVVGFLLPQTGCGRRKKPIEQDGQDTPSAGPQSELRARAETLWNAKTEEDWATVFEFEPTRDSENVTLDDFIAYCETEEPFRVHSASIEEVLTDGDLGWIKLDVSTSMRRFPNAPPVATTRWEGWLLVDDAWMPIPPNVADNFPETPEVRDLEQEAVLRERFDASWQARLDRDWEKLYDYIDPRDREEVDYTVFKDTHSLFEYLSCDVHWVQAKNGSGVVRVTVHHKLNDPSLTKLPERDATVREEWVRYEGEWYLDVRR